LIGLFSGCTVQEPTQETELVIMGVTGESKEFTLSEIKNLTSISGTSEYQNSFGNWRDKGTYKGIPISIFAAEVGGIQNGDILIVTSRDNYTQIFPYENIYPSSEWEAIQGTMILAYEFNDTGFPEWDDGLRIAFIPSDGQYSNEDSSTTSSLESKGVSGSRKWSKYVTKLEFRRESETITFGHDSTNYSLSWSQVLSLPSINESGRYITKEDYVSDPLYYTGVNLTYILDLLIDINQEFSIEIIASDAYSKLFLKDQFFGYTTIYDINGNETGFGGPESLSLILAYYQGNQQLEPDSGPFRSVYVGSDSPITGSKYWIRSVVYIKIGTG
jgi:hypothetical protein